MAHCWENTLFYGLDLIINVLTNISGTKNEKEILNISIASMILSGHVYFIQPHF